MQVPYEQARARPSSSYRAQRAPHRLSVKEAWDERYTTHPREIFKQTDAGKALRAKRDRAIWLQYKEKQTGLAAERERIRSRTFKTNHAILGLARLENFVSDLNDRRQEWDEDEVTGPSHHHA